MLEEVGYDVSKVITSMLERNSLANSLPTTRALPGNSLESSTGSGSSSLFLSSSVKTSSVSSGSVSARSSVGGSRVEHVAAKVGTVPAEGANLLGPGHGRDGSVLNFDLTGKRTFQLDSKESHQATSNLEVINGSYNLSGSLHSNEGSDPAREDILRHSAQGVENRLRGESAQGASQPSSNASGDVTDSLGGKKLDIATDTASGGGAASSGGAGKGGGGVAGLTTAYAQQQEGKDSKVGLEVVCSLQDEVGIMHAVNGRIANV